MRVNSPRMKSGLRVKSNVDSLQFTALEAKYGTKLEEVVLATMVSWLVDNYTALVRY